MTTLAPTVPLVNGAKMPRLGFGTWPLDDDAAEVAVAKAIEAGYRLFDTAENYRNEGGVGRALRNSGVPRDELFVTSKFNGEWHGVDEAQQACTYSAERLGVDYIDLLLIHWPLPARDRYVDAWHGLVKLLGDGRVRAIGVSNFKPAHLERIVEATGVVPDVNQVQLNPYVTRQVERAYHSTIGTVTESWAPLGKGNDLLVDPVITAIAERHGKTPAQVVLRWQVDLGLVPIPKSSHPERMRENLDVFDFELGSDDIAAIAALDRGDQAGVDSDKMGH